MNLNEFIELLPNHTGGSLATSVDNKTHIRGWQYQFSENNKFYFATTKAKNAFTDLTKNPYASFFAVVDGKPFDITGHVTFIQDSTKKQDIYEKIDPILQQMIPDANSFEFFCIDTGFVRYSENLGSPLQKITF
ncbi:MAG: hypothetical protein AB6733_08570 [Clostridiaceae bacterium]